MEGSPHQQKSSRTLLGTASRIVCHSEQSEAASRNLLLRRRGAKEAVTQWVICRRQKRPERVTRNEHRVRSKDERRRLRVRTHNCSLFIVNCSFVIAKRRHCPLLRPKDESFCILHYAFCIWASPTVSSGDLNLQPIRNTFCKETILILNYEL